MLPPALPAQYFGRNKVQYGRFDFQIIQTEHFDVYYYPAERQAALDIARMAERSYFRLSKALNHQFNERKPIIPYASHSEFQQTNTSGGEIDESTGGFTDFLRHRNIFPLAGSYAENEHVLMHEMVHQFQFDIWSRGRVGGGVQGIITANAPLWFGEGMAEYFSIGPVDPNTAMWLRDAALEGKLPAPEDFYRVFPYRFGHALVAYIGQRWGDEADRPDHQAGLRRRHRVGAPAGAGALLPQPGGPVAGRGAEAVPARNRQPGQGPRHGDASCCPRRPPAAPGTWRPRFRRTGRRIAYLSEKDFYFIDLWLADGNTGKTDPQAARVLRERQLRDLPVHHLLGELVAPTGRCLALAAQKGGKDNIIIVDVERNKQIRDIRLKLAGVDHPDLEPGREAAGVQRAGRAASPTSTSSMPTAPACASSPTTRMRTCIRSGLPTARPSPSPPTAARAPTSRSSAGATSGSGCTTWRPAGSTCPAGMDVGRNTNPQWSPDGKSLAFVSDRNGVANIYLHELPDGQTYQLTDFYTGVQGITAALAGVVLGPRRRPARLRVLRAGPLRHLHACASPPPSRSSPGPRRR